jgi:7,8-dihydroneopterin aldolase/epimerase/oxygenase
VKDAPFATIELRGIRAWGRHGANAGEQDVPQPLELDVTLSADVCAARTSDALEDTLDYAELHARIVRVVETESHRLLERLGESVLEAVMADKRVVMAVVAVAKPGLLAGATPVVTVTKLRPRKLAGRRSDKKKR